MNFLEAQLADGTVRLADGTTLRLPGPEGRPARDVLLGLRPEHILPEAREGASLTLLVRELEPLGPEQLLIGEVAGTRVVAKLPAHYPAAARPAGNPRRRHGEAAPLRPRQRCSPQRRIIVTEKMAPLPLQLPTPARVSLVLGKRRLRDLAHIGLLAGELLGQRGRDAAAAVEHEAPGKRAAVAGIGAALAPGEDLAGIAETDLAPLPERLVLVLPTVYEFHRPARSSGSQAAIATDDERTAIAPASNDAASHLHILLSPTLFHEFTPLNYTAGPGLATHDRGLGSAGGQPLPHAADAGSAPHPQARNAFRICAGGAASTVIGSRPT